MLKRTPVGANGPVLPWLCHHRLMNQSRNDWRRRLGRGLRDPWFWILVVVGALAMAALDQLLPETWADWGRAALLFLGIWLYSTFRVERYRD